MENRSMKYIAATFILLALVVIDLKTGAQELYTIAAYCAFITAIMAAYHIDVKETK